MKAVDGSPPWFGLGNPFPPAAVATFINSPHAELTIRTQAVRDTEEFIDSYVRAAGQGSDGDPGNARRERLAGTGRVCLIEGNYGTGKTHLAIEALSHIAAASEAGDIDTRAFYRITPGASFLALYKELVETIGQSEIQRRVREFYADVVAKSLSELPYTDDLVSELERGDAHPEDVVAHYGLREGALREQLRLRLRSVTENESFSGALVLLLEPDIDVFAWDWLAGGLPSQVLNERGIGKRLSTDDEALEALGVIALLYGRKNRRFVLVIDEFEKLALTRDPFDASRAQAFKRLLEVFHAAGALLILCSLPDIFNILPRDPGRIDKLITPSPLDEADVRWYIEETQKISFGSRMLEPFTPKGIGSLVSIAGGVAREVVRLCYFAFARASLTGNTITASEINLVARAYLPNDGVERARSEIEEILYEQGWQAERNAVVGEDNGIAVDFWIPGSASGSGCAVIVSGSVLEAVNAQELAGQLLTLRSAEPPRLVILVIGGYLPDDERQVLANALRGESLVSYNPTTFTRDFSRAIRQAFERIGEPGAAEETRGLRAELNRMARQQLNTMRAIQDLAGRTEDRLNALQASVETARPRQEAPPGNPPDVGTLPVEVERIFSVAQSSLSAYGGIDDFTTEAFAAAGQEPGATYPFVLRVRRDPDAFSGIGVATYLSDLLRSFRASVEDWSRRLESTTLTRGEGPTKAERERLQAICQAYNALYGAAPLFKLESLADVTAAAEGRQEGATAARSARRDALRRAFEGLGERVQQAASSAAGWQERAS
jgi:hypothetical protein